MDRHGSPKIYRMSIPKGCLKWKKIFCSWGTNNLALEELSTSDEGEKSGEFLI
jgi:hypothetical protein